MIWYLSFADETFRGGVVTEADSFEEAYFSTLINRVNPSGEVMGMPVPDGEVPDRRYFNRLLTRSDIEKFWPDSKSIREFEEEEEAL